MRLTRYESRSKRLSRRVRVASVADLHDAPYEKLLALLEEAEPDMVAVPGDFADTPTRRENGLGFLTACARRYPTFVSLGNHENKSDPQTLLPLLAKTGAELLDDRYVRFGELAVGGLSTGWRAGMRQNRGETPAPNLSFLAEFAALDAPRLLLCHHPEYYPRYIKKTSVDWILSGHAHGGQWCLFGHGIFAPGQGLFPRYHAGFYDGRMAQSRGLCRTHRYIPRIANPREVVLLTLLPAHPDKEG